MDKILWILLFLTLILFALYTPLNSSRGAVMSFKSLADDYIPLWTPFLIAYISFYFLIVFTFVYFFKKGRFERLKITLLALITAYFLAYLFLLVFSKRGREAGYFKPQYFLTGLIPGSIAGWRHIMHFPVCM